MIRRFLKRGKASRVVPGSIARRLRVADFSKAGTGEYGDDYDNPEPYALADVDTANLITSEVQPRDVRQRYRNHAPVLDLDVPATLVPSTTPGHSHLYIDVPMTWGQYRRLLNALADAGVIEQGYARASIARGYSAVRPPWVRKGAA